MYTYVYFGERKRKEESGQRWSAKEIGEVKRVKRER